MAFIFLGCKQGIGNSGEGPQIRITVKGDSHVTNIPLTLELPKGVGWGRMRAEIMKLVGYKDEYILQAYNLNDENGMLLNDQYNTPFENDTEIYIKSKLAAPEVENGISIILPEGVNSVKIKVKTANSSNAKVEGANSGTIRGDEGEETLTLASANSERCIKISKISSAIEILYCEGNKITYLNVQGLKNTLKHLNCKNNQLRFLNVQSLQKLEFLDCGENQFSALNVHGLTKLYSLSCYGNKLNAEAFIKIFDDLPSRDGLSNGQCFLYSEYPDHNDKSHKNFTFPEELKKAFNKVKNIKKWKMYRCAPTENWVPI